MDKAEEYKILKEQRKNNIHISFSEFSLFNQCGHRHLVEKHLGIIDQSPSIHLFFGNAIHASIELSLKDKPGIEKVVEFFRTLFTKSMMDNMLDTSDFRNEFPNFIEQGEQILRILDLDVLLIDHDIVSIEESLYELIDGIYYFKGFIDLVVKNKKTHRYKIIDWKSSGSDWDVKKKKKDEEFLGQMRFYKFFWGKKNNIPLSEIDCEYVVLNRLIDKKDPKSYPGRIQIVNIDSTEKEMKKSLENLAFTVKMIHIDKKFPKVKFTKNGSYGCFFCPLKGGYHPLCNLSERQDKVLLKEHKKKS